VPLTAPSYPSTHKSTLVSGAVPFCRSFNPVCSLVSQGFPLNRPGLWAVLGTSVFFPFFSFISPLILNPGLFLPSLLSWYPDCFDFLGFWFLLKPPVIRLVYSPLVLLILAPPPPPLHQCVSLSCVAKSFIFSHLPGLF